MDTLPRRTVLWKAEKAKYPRVALIGFGSVYDATKAPSTAKFCTPFSE